MFIFINFISVFSSPLSTSVENLLKKEFLFLRDTFSKRKHSTEYSMFRHYCSWKRLQFNLCFDWSKKYRISSHCSEWNFLLVLIDYEFLEAVCCELLAQVVEQIRIVLSTSGNQYKKVTGWIVQAAETGRFVLSISIIFFSLRRWVYSGNPKNVMLSISEVFRSKPMCPLCLPSLTWMQKHSYSRIRHVFVYWDFLQCRESGAAKKHCSTNKKQCIENGSHWRAFNGLISIVCAHRFRRFWCACKLHEVLKRLFSLSSTEVTRQVMQ